MLYAALFFEHPTDMGKRNDPAQAGSYWGAWMAYVDALRTAGVSVGGQGLQPPETATVLRGAGATRQVQDGPFADSKEQLGGFMILDVPDLDTALAWAAKSPALPLGAVEVRPVLLPPPGA
jgi:hypothetical protein